MSRWYENEKAIQKIKFIIMERTKKPLVLTGGKFFNLTLATFVLVEFCLKYFFFLLINFLCCS